MNTQPQLNRFPGITAKALAAALLGWLAATAGFSQGAVRIENFSLIDAANNSPVSLSDFRGEKAVVLVFMSNYCPFAKLYEDRILTMADQHRSQGVQFLLINSNTSLDHIDDSVEEMARRAKEKNYRVPYLADKSQKVAAMLKATKNPEVFVLQNTGGGNFTLIYRGAIDDNPQVPQEVTVHFLRDAVASVISRKNLSYAEKRPVGCLIQKE